MMKRSCFKKLKLFNEKLNQNHTGPAVFLVKQLFKRFGHATLISVSKKSTLLWVLPKELNTPNEV